MVDFQTLSIHYFLEDLKTEHVSHLYPQFPAGEATHLCLSDCTILGNLWADLWPVSGPHTSVCFARDDDVEIHQRDSFNQDLDWKNEGRLVR